MSKKQLIGVVFALLALGACSTEQMVGTGVGAAGGYAVDGKSGALIGGAGGGLLGTIID